VSAAFGTLLEQGLRAAALSQARLARLAAVDPAYVNRLVRHRQAPPSRAVALRFADALKLDQVQRDELLMAAGHCPETIARLDDDRRRALLTLLAR
jgi:transcriptional regulator with XRE-family HTH domain